MSEKIILSPSLTRFMRKVYDNEYCLFWVDTFIRTYINKEDILREINQRYVKLFNDNEKLYARKPNTLSGIRKWRLSMRAMIADLKGLSHADYDVLRYIKTPEALTNEIMTINDKEIEFSKED
jgi:hypothetical protein